MFVKVNCQFCRQPFDFDSSSGLPQIDCPHCGKQNHVEHPGPAPKPELTIQHGAPNLSGAKPCPSCRHQVARDATLCVHCGYNFATGKKSGDKGWLASNLGFVLLLAAVAIAAVLGGFYLLRPQEAPLPPPPAEPAPAPAPAKPPPQAPAQKPNAATNAPAEPVAAPEPPPPPAPTPAELAAQKAEAERAAFAAKKAEAERNLRLQLAAREPPYKLNEPIELRRKNGLIDKGTFSGYAGEGTNRVALVATPRGEIGIPLVALDNPTRRRIDPEYREAFIQHLLSTQVPAPAGTPDPGR
jgi:hypothetical protein